MRMVAGKPKAGSLSRQTSPSVSPPARDLEIRASRLLAVAAHLLQNTQNVTALDLGEHERLLFPRIPWTRSSDLRREVRLLDVGLSLGKHDRALHRMLELANVARPVV